MVATGNPIQTGDAQVVEDPIPDGILSHLSNLTDDDADTTVEDSSKNDGDKLEIVDYVEECTWMEILSSFAPIELILGFLLIVVGTATGGPAVQYIVGFGGGVFAVGAMSMNYYWMKVVIGGTMYQYLHHIKEEDHAKQAKEFVEGLRDNVKIQLVLVMKAKGARGDETIIARHWLNEALFRRKDVSPFTAQEAADRIKQFKDTSRGGGHLKINGRATVKHGNEENLKLLMAAGEKFLIKKYEDEGLVEKGTAVYRRYLHKWKDGSGQEYTMEDTSYCFHRMALSKGIGMGALCNFCTLNLATFYILSMLMVFVPYKWIFEHSYKSRLKINATMKLTLLNKSEIVETGMSNFNDLFPFDSCVKAVPWWPKILRECYSPTIYPVDPKWVKEFHKESAIER